jgi:CRISPR-associated protein Cas4
MTTIPMTWTAPGTVIMLSALQHYLYCPRQCALIHQEQAWAENAFTVEGKLLHEKADSGAREKRRDLRVETGVLLHCPELGLTGKADVVEFHRKGRLWMPFPVEYKRGRAKRTDADRVQLCAQALCLEAMTGLPVPEGALFYGASRRREPVDFSDDLRRITRETAEAVRTLLDEERLPAPPSSLKACAHCSLTDLCLPEAFGDKAGRYLDVLCEES